MTEEEIQAQLYQMTAPQAILSFYETEAEKQEIEAFQAQSEKSFPLAVQWLPPIPVFGKNRRLAEAFEVSRTPTLIFFHYTTEVGRVHRPAVWEQLAIIIQSMQNYIPDSAV